MEQLQKVTEHDEINMTLSTFYLGFEAWKPFFRRYGSLYDWSSERDLFLKFDFMVAPCSQSLDTLQPRWPWWGGGGQSAVVCINICLHSQVFQKSMVTKKFHVPLDCETSRAGILKIIYLAGGLWRHLFQWWDWPARRSSTHEVGGLAWVLAGFPSLKIL